VQQSRLVLGLAAVFAGLTVTMVALAAAFRDVFVLLMALPFGAATYLFWYHATGRIAEGIHERARKQARQRAQRGPQGGFGAGPRGEWTPPGGRQRWEGRARQARAGANASGPRTNGMTDAKAYRILGVERGASESEVKAAYRARAKETHPDREDGDERMFKRVTAAYDHLTR
jgi:hypothetical protein